MAGRRVASQGSRRRGAALGVVLGVLGTPALAQVSGVPTGPSPSLPDTTAPQPPSPAQPSGTATTGPTSPEQALQAPGKETVEPLAGAKAPKVQGAPFDLARLQTLARQRDPRVQVAQAQLDKLQGLAKEAYWAWFPKFETILAVAGPTPEARNDGLGGPPSTPASYMYDTDLGQVGFTFRAQINALLPIYTFGKLSALRKAGEHAVVAGQALKETAENATAQQVVEAFFGYQLARMGKESLEEGLTRITDAGGRIDGLLEKESPQVTTLDQFKIQYFKQLVQARLAQAESGMHVALAALRLVIGVAPDAPISVVTEDLKAPDFELKSAGDYVELALNHRPELKAANAGILAREQQVLIREREYFPDFGILGFFNFAYTSSATRQRSPFAYDPYNDLSSGVALVTRMTFDIPQKGARVDQARAELAELQHQREAITGGIRLQVIQLREGLIEAQKRAADYALAEKAARRWATSAYENFELGVGDTRELTDAFIALGQASGEKLKAWYDAEIGLRALANAVGVKPEQVTLTH